MDTKIYYEIDEFFAGWVILSGTGIPEKIDDDKYRIAASEEVEQLAIDFNIQLTPTNHRAFFIDGVGYRIAWRRNWDGCREPVLIRSTTELVEEGDEYNVVPNSNFVHAYFIGISKAGFLYDKEDNEVSSISDWAAAWQEELRQDCKTLKQS